MNSILKSTFAAAALAFSLAALSAGSASADCGLPHGGMPGAQNSEEGPYDWQRDRKGRLGGLPGLDLKFDMLRGGMILMDAAAKAKPAAGKKKNCDKLRDAIAKGERRLEQMKSRLDQMLGDFSEKKRVSTNADVGYAADAITKLDDAIKGKETTLKRQRKKLKKCLNG
jgi:uncharacterized coiled-coil protein SlyX